MISRNKKKNELQKLTPILFRQLLENILFLFGIQFDAAAIFLKFLAHMETETVYATS